MRCSQQAPGEHCCCTGKELVRSLQAGRRQSEPEMQTKALDLVIACELTIMNQLLKNCCYINWAISAPGYGSKLMMENLEQRDGRKAITQAVEVGNPKRVFHSKEVKTLSAATCLMASN